MKKHFLFVAMALAAMSSCSDNEELGTGIDNGKQPVNDSEPVLIELGTSAPSISGSSNPLSRGMGSIGGLTKEENKWSGQTLGIWMLKNEGTSESLALEGEPGKESYILKDMVFQAPNENAVGKIQMFASTAQQEAGVVKAKYFPNTGRYNFYGFHLDDAQALESGTFGEEGEQLKAYGIPEPEGTDESSPTKDWKVKTKKLEGIVIDGSQDLMSAVTAVIPTEEPKNEGEPYYGTNLTNTGDDTWATMKDRTFSAWSARRKVQPHLIFEHKLARFRFFIKAGDATAATKEWNSSAWVDRSKVKVDDPASEDPQQTIEVSPAVSITNITVKKLARMVDMELTRNGETSSTVALAVNAGNKAGDFVLKGKDGVDQDNLLDALQPTAPEYNGSTTEQTAKEAEGFKESTQVGESLMFLPESGTTDTSVDLEIAVQQAVVDEEPAPGIDSVEGYPTYTLKKDILKYNLKASEVKVKNPEGDGFISISKFEPGKNYDITIKVYSYQRIEISAELSQWADGGSVEIAPGDQF